MLFHKTTQKAFRWLMIVVGILIIVSMVIYFFPGVYY
jgi:predicted nucleic acid-binding Zn ribbon protein